MNDVLCIVDHIYAEIHQNIIQCTICSLKLYYLSEEITPFRSEILDQLCAGRLYHTLYAIPEIESFIRCYRYHLFRAVVEGVEMSCWHR